jgi:hypothetical protein
MIHCQKCKHQNIPDAKKCDQCGANLLPGAGMRDRFVVLGLAIFVSAIAYFVFKNDMVLRCISILFGVLVVGFGIFWLFRKTPLYERYETRAKRHLDLDPQQAIADYGTAIDLAPELFAFDLLCARAKLCQRQGMVEDAKSDWQRALENVNHRIAAIKDTDLELHKQRAETYKHLGMQDEYAMEMLGYTIAKELSLKFEKGEIVRDINSGIKKGVEDTKRGQLQHLRGQVMNKRKYGIVGHCAQCGSIVELNQKLECTNNPKHYKITNIKPIIKTTDKA